MRYQQDSKRTVPSETVTPAKKKAKAATDPPGAPKKKKVEMNYYVMPFPEECRRWTKCEECGTYVIYISDCVRPHMSCRECVGKRGGL